MESDRTNRTFIFSEDIPWQGVDTGVERRILGFDSRLMMVCVRFEVSAVGTLHRHPHRRVKYVQTGRFRVTIEGEDRELGAGDCFFVDPDLLHGEVALDAGVLVDVFTPAREEFIPLAQSVLT